MHHINFRNNKIGLKRAFIKSLWVLHLHRGLKTYNPTQRWRFDKRWVKLYLYRWDRKLVPGKQRHARSDNWSLPNRPIFIAIQSLWRRANARNGLPLNSYDGQFTLSTQLITLNYIYRYDTLWLKFALPVTLAHFWPLIKLEIWKVIDTGLTACDTLYSGVFNFTFNF